LASAGASLRSGDELGSYQLLLPIGAGGMGRVWVAREAGEPALTRLVAIKTALAEEGASEGFYKVLFDEARIASLVQHPNVCVIHGAEKSRGVVYLVMDYSDGGSLREILDVLPEHRLDIHVAVRVVSRVCAGLHAAHELIGEDGEPLHVVHRDVSPQNVLIATSGQVRITDFGVAKARGQLHAPTQTGEVKGKLSYMAPEQVTTKDVDRRADVFALGCVLYEATVGERPFSGGDALATLYQLLEQPLTPPSEKRPDYPPELEKIVLKAMERDREARFATAEDLARALERFLMSEKARVSDMRIAELVKTTLAAPIAKRAADIAQAIAAIAAAAEAKTRVPASVVEPTVAPLPTAEEPSAEVTLAKAATLAGPTLSGTAIPGFHPRRGPRLFALVGAGVLLLVGAVLLLRPNADPPPSPGVSAVTPVAPPSPVVPLPSADPTPPAPVESVVTPGASSSTTSARPIKPTKKPPSPRPVASVPSPVETGRKVRPLDEDNPFSK